MTIKTRHHHGHATGKGTRTYRIWMGMLARCRHASQPHYRLYGGRGVTVCNRWQAFQNFLADMGECPSNDHTVDRHPDKDGNYEPSNCRWATYLQQGENKRNNRTLAFRGETLSMSAWARKLGISLQTISDRLRRGWSTEDALGTPPRRSSRHPMITFQGITLSVDGWAKRLGVIPGTLYSRLEQGWSAEKTLATPVRVRH